MNTLQFLYGLEEELGRTKLGADHDVVVGLVPEIVTEVGPLLALHIQPLNFTVVLRSE